MTEKPTIHLAFQSAESEPDVRQPRHPTWVVIGIGGCGGNTADDWAFEETGLPGDGHYAFVDTEWEALSRKEALSLELRGRANTDNQCYRLGPEGLGTGSGYGAGGKSEFGAAYAQAAMPKLLASFEGANVVFVVVGLGGGTGSGASPVIADAAWASGARVVALVTMPFTFEGASRKATADQALAKLRDSAHEVAIVHLEDLMRESNGDMDQDVAFKLVSDVMLAHAQGALAGVIGAREVTLLFPSYGDSGSRA